MQEINIICYQSESSHVYFISLKVLHHSETRYVSSTSCHWEVRPVVYSFYILWLYSIQYVHVFPCSHIQPTFYICNVWAVEQAWTASARSRGNGPGHIMIPDIPGHFRYASLEYLHSVYFELRSWLEESVYIHNTIICFEFITYDDIWFV